MNDTNEPNPTSTGSVVRRASEDPDRMLAARLHGIADHSMAIIIGNMIQEMITELQMRKSPGHPGHISFTLAYDERRAIEWAARAAAAWTNEAVASDGDHSEVALSDRAAREYAKTLRGLLGRLK